MTLIELAERVEKASGADRELDALICEAVDLPLCVLPDCHPEVLRRSITQTLNGSWPHDTDNVPAYTASLDAALTLVPEGWVWLRKSPQAMSVYEPPEDEKAWAIHIGGRGATPALALVAAALRARAQQEQTI